MVKKMHIRAISLYDAARKIISAMDDMGGTWIVWHDSGYNFLMAPARSPIADGVRRMWSDLVAGEFDSGETSRSMFLALEKAYCKNTHASPVVRGEARKIELREYNRNYMREMRAKKKLDAAYGQKVAA